MIADGAPPNTRARSPKTRRPPPPATPRDPLVGKFVLTFAEPDGGAKSVRYQVKILARTAEGRYLIQFFDWFAGEPSDQQLVAEQWFIAERAQFYDHADHWRSEGDRYSSLNAERCRKKIALEGIQ